MTLAEELAAVRGRRPRSSRRSRARRGPSTAAAPAGPGRAGGASGADEAAILAARETARGGGERGRPRVREATGRPSGDAGHAPAGAGQSRAARGPRLPRGAGLTHDPNASSPAALAPARASSSFDCRLHHRATDLDSSAPGGGCGGAAQQRAVIVERLLEAVDAAEASVPRDPPPPSTPWRPLGADAALYRRLRRFAEAGGTSWCTRGWPPRPRGGRAGGDLIVLDPGGFLLATPRPARTARTPRPATASCSTSARRVARGPGDDRAPIRVPGRRGARLAAGRTCRGPRFGWADLGGDLDWPAPSPRWWPARRHSSRARHAATTRARRAARPLHARRPRPPPGQRAASGVTTSGTCRPARRPRKLTPRSSTETIWSPTPPQRSPCRPAGTDLVRVADLYNAGAGAYSGSWCGASLGVSRLLGSLCPGLGFTIRRRRCGKAAPGRAPAERWLLSDARSFSGVTVTSGAYVTAAAGRRRA